MAQSSRHRSKSIDVFARRNLLSTIFELFRRIVQPIDIVARENRRTVVARISSSLIESTRLISQWNIQITAASAC